MNRYKSGAGKGWRFESTRHSMASRGISTGKKNKHAFKNICYAMKGNDFNLNGRYYSWDYVNGKHKLSLGNLSDAGWFWDGGNDELMGFFIRVQSSSFSDVFLRDLQKRNINFSDFKKDLIASIETGDGLYMVSGDNRNWRFGQGYDMDVRSELENEEISDEEIKSAEDYYYSEAKYPDANYDLFYEENSDEYKKDAENAVKASSSFSDFFSNVKKLNADWREKTYDWQSNVSHDEFYEILNKWKKGKM